MRMMEEKGLAVAETETELSSLVPRAAGGDSRSLQRVISIIYPKVLSYARIRLSGGRHPTPEDVAQEICLAVATSISKFVDQGKPFMAFVYGIASNKVADAHRAYSRDVANPTEDVPETEVELETPESFALVAAGSNRVKELLDLLGDKPREIITLRVFVGLSAEETAEIVGSTPGAVRIAQHRALATLRKALEQEN
ncbi:sigma-70 family RNA polymerase sigma factor [Corynebacterium pseudotuberculosis]|uniref:sigma-70 family RNA polymerase sigma factor n=1 Tax=Corynebacterium pseudotuberculosis TaxID=1719 RepID=UPI0002660691|nr:sigma-70 family RNA polymerase sigma factor [Corynebacterium pseudotuberculosis]AFM06784.1 sigma-70 family RNA polymerase sigma factor [Corynebacterium pseudotuberculosis Cp162]APG81157.1 RNA polymerase sigma-D factor [Corynebacterium pseudotuberculosis]WFP67621.1 sigma-70 family RNA polymerase sigma factor [Corynebacterium pseudotuberculosis]